MKHPASKNLAKSIASNSPGGRKVPAPDVRRLSVAKAGPVPGEGGVSPSPGMLSSRSAKALADELGEHFGSSQRAKYYPD